MLVYTLGETLYAVLYGCVHGVLHVCEAQDRGVIYSCKWLLDLRGFLEEVHHFFKLIFGAERFARIPPLVHDLEEHIIFLSHVVRTSATILYGGGEADVRRRLREGRRVKLVIPEITEERLRRRDVSFIYFSLGSRANCDLKMEFL